ncbi:hypothetical protein [Methanobrevibacter sp.]|uniref:hypothetical protein n=1 Tax=Methanobrevibacter sp. TaxID=66852 RepID=UPI0038674634
MKLEYLVIISILVLILIPISFASEDNLDNLTETSDEILIEETEVENSQLMDNQSVGGDIGYFSENNENIENPLLDDTFANPTIRHNDRNTFYVNDSYIGYQSGNKSFQNS